MLSAAATAGLTSAVARSGTDFPFKFTMPRGDPGLLPAFHRTGRDRRAEDLPKDKDGYYNFSLAALWHRAIAERHPALTTRASFPDAVSAKIFWQPAAFSASVLTERPELTLCLGYLRAGDTLVVWRLDRLGRSRRASVTQSGINALKPSSQSRVSVHHRDS